MEHDEIYKDTWKDEKDEWLPDVKKPVLWAAFSYARYTMGMEE